MNSFSNMEAVMSRIRDFKSGRCMPRTATMTSLALVVFVIPQVLLAQRDPTRDPTQTRAGTSSAASPFVVRTSGDDEAPQRAVPSVQSLTAEQTKQILAPLGLALSAAAGPWKVTPGQPVTDDKRVQLAFTEVQALWPFGAVMYGRTPGAVLVSVRALNVGEQYLIDCLVSPVHPGYRVKAPGGVTNVVDNTNHVQTIWVAGDPLRATFRIERAFSNDNWVLLGCDVSRLQ
jgi:hypothetical protein